MVNAGSTSLKLYLVGEAGESTRVDEFDDVDPGAVDCVAHRVVHGGARFHDPVLVDDEVHAELHRLESLAPLHNAPALRELDAARERFPELPHVAVFDTAFHATIPPAAATYAVPRQWREEWGIRRYGFHGLSVAWSVERAPEVIGRAAEGLRMVVCHLGGGSSVTAVADGRSVDKKIPSWLLSGLLHPHFRHLKHRRPPLSWLQERLSIFASWWRWQETGCQAYATSATSERCLTVWSSTCLTHG